MKKVRIFAALYIVVISVLIPFKDSMAQYNDYWEKEWVLIAHIDFPFCSASAVGGPDAFEGVEFPFVLGYLAFSDANNEQKVVFTPAPGYDPSKLLSFIDKVNHDGYVSVYSGHIAIGRRDFAYAILSELKSRYSVNHLVSGVIGEYRNTDITFSKTTVFNTERDRKEILELGLFDYGDVTYTPRQ